VKPCAFYRGNNNGIDSQNGVVYWVVCDKSGLSGENFDGNEKE